MSPLLDVDEKSVLSEIDEILYFYWDPIGVSDIPQARNEYISYVPRILEILKGGATVQDMDAHLRAVFFQEMMPIAELSGDRREST